jgi:putative DNA primase/helicase
MTSILNKPLPEGASKDPNHGSIVLKNGNDEVIWYFNNIALARAAHNQNLQLSLDVLVDGVQSQDIESAPTSVLPRGLTEASIEAWDSLPAPKEHILPVGCADASEWQTWLWNSWHPVARAHRDNVQNQKKFFSINTSPLTTVTKRVRKQIEQWRKSKTLDDPELVVKWLEKTYKREEAARIIQKELGSDYLDLLSPVREYDLNGKDFDNLYKVAEKELPKVWCHDGELYVFEAGKYRLVSVENFAQKLAQVFAPERYTIMTGAKDPTYGLTTRHVKEITERFLRDNSQDQSDVAVVPFKNGYINLEDRKFYASDKDLYVLGGPECNYDPNATCPEWHRVLQYQWKDDQQSIDLLQEMMGYFLTDDLSHHALFTFIGKAGAGKGTIINVIDALIGDSYFSTFNTSDLGDNFGLQSFLGKTVAVAPDVRGPYDRRLMTKILETILQITSENKVSVNRKNKSRLPSVLLRIRILMAFNKFSDAQSLLADPEMAAARRILALAFNSSYVGKEDRKIMEKLIAELPGIANWALEGLYRLREKGFTINKFSLELREATAQTSFGSYWDEEGNSKIQFPIKTTDLYKPYQEWCLANFIKPNAPKHWTSHVLNKINDASTKTKLVYKEARCSHSGCTHKTYYFMYEESTPVCPKHACLKLSTTPDDYDVSGVALPPEVAQGISSITEEDYEAYLTYEYKNKTNPKDWD